MQKTLITILLLLGPAVQAQENPNQRLRKALDEVPMVRTVVPFDECAEELAEAQDHAPLEGVRAEIEANKDDHVAVRFYYKTGKVVRVTCYKDQRFIETWKQR